MEKISAINKKHQKIIDNYVKYVQGIVYVATEDYSYNKFLEFNDILDNVTRYTNSFKNIVSEKAKTREWAYMIPNLVLYSCMGFLTGISNKKNSEVIEKLSSKLFDRTLDVVGETTDILHDIEAEEKKRDLIAKIHKKNEHYS